MPRRPVAAAILGVVLASAVSAAPFDRPVDSDYWERRYDGYFRK